jgi:hypothetical protein
MLPSAKRQKDIFTKECYRPSKSLTSLITELLRLGHEEFQRQQKESAGVISNEEITKERKEAKERRENLNKQKVVVLNRHIFPAMANLTTLLEQMLVHPYIHEIFDKDLQALFFAQSKTSTDKEYIFRRFIRASMMHQIRKQEKDEDGIERSVTTLLPEYRFIVCEIMQIALWEMVMGGVGTNKFKSHREGFLKDILVDDVGRAAAWMKMFADEPHRNLKLDTDKRPALF